MIYEHYSKSERERKHCPKEALVTILDKKLDEKLKPICLLMDGLKDGVNFLSDKFDVIMKRIEFVETRCNEAMTENKRLKNMNC